MTSATYIHEIERQATLSPDQISDRRKAMDSDVWLFIKWICGHGADDIEYFHRPFAYMMAGDAVRLAACLDIYRSEVTDQIRRILDLKEISYHTKEGIYQLREKLSHINDRQSRSIGKTTVSLDVLLWTAGLDPNRDLAIVSKSDPAAYAMCEAIGQIMLAEQPLPGATLRYRDFYSDRLFPQDTTSYITMKWIQMRGRTEPRQKTIEARGINSQWYSKHYNLIYGDDLSSTEAKQGEATVEDANRFIASLHGISKAARYGGTRYTFNGTIQSAKDDHATLSANSDYLTVVVPIWRHPTGAQWNLSNLNEDGVPVLPEMYDITAIRKMRKDTLENPKFGAISWLQNFCMTAHEAGSMEFSAELLRRSKFVWTTKRSYGTRGQEIQKRYIRRYLWTTDKNGNKIPKIDPTLDMKSRESDEITGTGVASICRCWYEGPHKQHAYLEFDPLTLTRALGVDQAVTGKGDKWSVAAGCQDPYGYKYALKGRAGRGRGYVDLINAIPLVFNQWGGRSNPPRYVGIESNAAQVVTADWMQRAQEFAFLARRIVKVSPGRMQKEQRIFNQVLANLELGTLLLDPNDTDRDVEMLGYSSQSSDPEDDIMDSIAIMTILFGQSTGESDQKTVDEYSRDQIQQYVRDCDQTTGVDVSFDPMEYMWDSIGSGNSGTGGPSGSGGGGSYNPFN